MTLFEMLRLEPQLEPLMPDIEKAIATFRAYAANTDVQGGIRAVRRILSDPDVKDALAVALKVADILQKAETQ